MTEILSVLQMAVIVINRALEKRPSGIIRDFSQPSAYWRDLKKPVGESREGGDVRLTPNVQKKVAKESGNQQIIETRVETNLRGLFGSCLHSIFFCFSWCFPAPLLFVDRRLYRQDQGFLDHRFPCA